MTPRLVAVAGPLNGWTIYLDGPITSIGRYTANDVELNDALVSRRHCLIKKEGERHVIEDLGSANGTFYNGERVIRIVLKGGCLIDIGTSRFIFWLSEFTNPAPAAGIPAEARTNCSSHEKTVDLSGADKL